MSSYHSSQRNRGKKIRVVGFLSQRDRILWAVPLWVVAFLVAYPEYVRPIPRWLISDAFVIAGSLVFLWGLIRPRRVPDHLPTDDTADLTVKVGLDPLRWDLDLFQSVKLLPVLVGQHYSVRLKITNKSSAQLSNVTMLLRMWIKKHGKYETKDEYVKIPKIVKRNSSYTWYSQKPYLMCDTGAADLELLQASDNGKPLTFEYQNRPGETFMYAYHVEPWRSAVLAIAISSAAVAVSLFLALAGRCP